MAKIYTRTGDAGTTGLLGPDRVPKDDARVEAMGAVDELNAALGMTIVALRQKASRDTLLRVQDDLFTVGAELATPGAGAGAKVPRVTAQHVARLEAAMDRLDVGRVTEFVLPRGSEALTRLHWSRTVARRAERRVVTLSRRESVNPELLRYLNRLSSLLYTMAVWVQTRERRKPEHPTYGR
ncbi:MAG: cob(I)yrinic acid a,c-diamide adenosyltransferase [Methanobacteriota archaeon]